MPADVDVEIDPEQLVRGWRTITGVHNFEPHHLQEAVDSLAANGGKMPWERILGGPIGYSSGFSDSFVHAVNAMRSMQSAMANTARSDCFVVMEDQRGRPRTRTLQVDETHGGCPRRSARYTAEQQRHVTPEEIERAMQFTLAQITGFIAVAENLHFGRAAEELNMTQPPLSRQIQKLEKSIGVHLFERNNRTVTLTPAGEAFLAEAYGLLASVERAPRRAQKIAEGSWGQITIGCTAVSTFGVLGSLVSTLADRLPGVSVEIAEMVTADQVKALTEGRIDIGLGRVGRIPETIDATLVLSEQLVLAVPSDHKFADRGSVGTKEIAGQRLLMHDATKARYFYDLTVRYIDVEANEVAHSLSQILTIVNLVAAGRGIAVVSESAARLGVEGVNYVPLRDAPRDVVELHAIWAPESRNPALHEVLKLLRTL